MIHKMRRLRRLDTTRTFERRETRLSVSDLVYSIFVDVRVSTREAIPSIQICSQGVGWLNGKAVNAHGSTNVNEARRRNSLIFCENNRSSITGGC